MLRLFVLLLILANGLYFAWTDNLLRPYGFAPTAQREPQRIAQQIHPQAVRVVAPADAKRADAQLQAELASKECLQAGPFSDEQATVVRTALEAALPAGTWQLQVNQIAERWIVYMGKFSSAESLAKKREELAVMHLTLHSLKNPDLQIGLSLGGFDNQADAQAELARLNLRGIRTARVVQESPARQQTLLRLPAVTAELKAQLSALQPALAGLTLQTCAVAPKP